MSKVVDVGIRYKVLGKSEYLKDVAEMRSAYGSATSAAISETQKQVSSHGVALKQMSGHYDMYKAGALASIKTIAEYHQEWDSKTTKVLISHIKELQDKRVDEQLFTKKAQSEGDVTATRIHKNRLEQITLESRALKQLSIERNAVQSGGLGGIIGQLGVGRNITNLFSTVQSAFGGDSPVGFGGPAMLNGASGIAALPHIIGAIGPAALGAMGGLAGLGIAFKDFESRGQRAVEILQEQRLAFESAGLTGGKLNAEMQRSNSLAEQLSERWNVESDRVRQLSAYVAQLGNITGTQNSQIVRMGIAVEEITKNFASGSLTAEQFAKVLARDPEAETYVGRLTLAFPALAEKMKAAANNAEEISIAMDFLTPKMKELDERANSQEQEMKRATVQWDEFKRAIGIEFFHAAQPALQLMVDFTSALAHLGHIFESTGKSAKLSADDIKAFSQALEDAKQRQKDAEFGSINLATAQRKVGIAFHDVNDALTRHLYGLDKLDEKLGLSIPKIEDFKQSLDDERKTVELGLDVLAEHLMLQGKLSADDVKQIATLKEKEKHLDSWNKVRHSIAVQVGTENTDKIPKEKPGFNFGEEQKRQWHDEQEKKKQDTKETYEEIIHTHEIASQREVNMLEEQGYSESMLRQKSFEAKRYWLNLELEETETVYGLMSKEYLTMYLKLEELDHQRNVQVSTDGKKQTTEVRTITRQIEDVQAKSIKDKIDREAKEEELRHKRKQDDIQTEIADEKTRTAAIQLENITHEQMLAKIASDAYDEQTKAGKEYMDAVLHPITSEIERQIQAYAKLGSVGSQILGGIANKFLSIAEGKAASALSGAIFGDEKKNDTSTTGGKGSEVDITALLQKVLPSFGDTPDTLAQSGAYDVGGGRYALIGRGDDVLVSLAQLGVHGGGDTIFKRDSVFTAGKRDSSIATAESTDTSHRNALHRTTMEQLQLDHEERRQQSLDRLNKQVAEDYKKDIIERRKRGEHTEIGLKEPEPYLDPLNYVGGIGEAGKHGIEHGIESSLGKVAIKSVIKDLSLEYGKSAIDRVAESRSGSPDVGAGEVGASGQAQAAADSIKEESAARDANTKSLTDAQDKISDVGKGFGILESGANLLGIKLSKEAKGALDTGSQLAGIAGSVASVVSLFLADGAYISHRHAIRAATGMVVGPGGPRDDKIPAWLSNGEGVLNSDAVNHYGGADFVHAINRKSLSRSQPRSANEPAYVSIQNNNSQSSDASHVATVMASEIRGLKSAIEKIQINVNEDAMRRGTDRSTGRLAHLSYSS